MDSTNSTLILHIGLILVFGAWYFFACCKQLNKDEGNLHFAVSSSLSMLISHPRIPICLLVIGISCQTLVSGLLTLLHPIIPSAFASYDKLMEQASSDNTPVILIVCICLLAPIGEELLFRGVIFHYLTRLIKPIYAVMIQALLFGIYHGNIVQGIYAAFMGVLLGILVTGFHSILPSVCLHLVVNVSMYLIPQALYQTTLSCCMTVLLSTGIFAFAWNILRKTSIPSA
ncbi:MAG: CPBP family intramembrane metalloprotease [Lachnospiraceae bacterium]|nr:CPBP family intramembrane metalloprotease [Lachnospiraceae bacterium]